MMEDALDWILSLCKKRHVIVDFQTFYPTCSYAELNMVFVNTDETPEEQYPFAIAHELGHLSTEIKGWFYFACPNNGYKGEHGADVYGMHLLYEGYCKPNGIYFDNAQTFIKQMGIPQKLLGDAEIMLKKDHE